MDNVYIPGMQTQGTGDVYIPGMQSMGNQSLSTTPQSIQSAQTQLGSQTDNGECQRFVEQQVYGKTGIFPSASNASQYYAQQGQLNPDISKAQPGSLIYFNDPSQPNGHVGIYEGNGTMISATNNGVEEDNVANWLQRTGQTPVGFVQVGGTK